MGYLGSLRRMTIPEDILLANERVIHETKLHWVGLMKEILYSVGFVAAFILFVGIFNLGWLMWPVTIVWLALLAIGLVGWYSTIFAITDRRVLFRKGVVSKKGYEIPIDQIQDVGYQQSMIQRLFGAGDLVVKTSASTARTAVRNIPDPVKLKTLIGDTRESKIESRFERAAGGSQPPASTPTPSNKSRAEQLEILARLHDEGKLTDFEFESEKRRVIGDG